jgi:hypothetical protein
LQVFTVPQNEYKPFIVTDLRAEHLSYSTTSPREYQRQTVFGEAEYHAGGV